MRTLVLAVMAAETLLAGTAVDLTRKPMFNIKTYIGAGAGVGLSVVGGDGLSSYH